MFHRIRAFIELKIAQFHCERKQLEKGINILKHIISYAPYYHFAYFHLGYRLLEQEKYADACFYLRQAIQHYSTNSVYHTFLGLALYDQGDYREARKTLADSLQLDTQNLFTYNCLALCDLEEGNFASFKKILDDRGIFESAIIQSRMILALQSYKDKLIRERDAVEMT